MDKGQIRRALLAKRPVRSSAEGAAKLAAGFESVCAAHGLGPGLVLAGFIPVRGEPDVLACLGTVQARGDQVVVPRTLPDNRLEWVAWFPDVAMAPDRHGLRAPVGDPLPAALTGSRVLMLIPALAVDRGGARLGFGAGYYDRALAEVPRWPAGPLRVAVVHPDEVMEQALPQQPHDEPVDAVLTAAGWFRTRGQRLPP